MGDSTAATITELPSANSSVLHLTHPTPEERLATWTLNGKNWGGALPLADYIEREKYLMTVPLAKDSGVTHWILTDSTLPPNSRPILSACESLRKPTLTFSHGTLLRGITHGIGSVFCPPQYRGKGYGVRMLKELGVALKTHQTTPSTPCHFSILYSDIGKKYYAKLGWDVYPSAHLEFPPSTAAEIEELKTSTATPLTYAELPALCELDTKAIVTHLSSLPTTSKTTIALLPSYDQMQWHHLREDFVTSKIFGRSPTIKGAIAGPPGKRVWAVWTRSFYGPVTDAKAGNMLHILRLVVENEETEGNVEALRAVLQIAKREAAEWKLNAVEVWNLSEEVKELVRASGLTFRDIAREEESIASLMWYGGVGGEEKEKVEVDWYANDKFGWC